MSTEYVSMAKGNAEKHGALTALLEKFAQEQPDVQGQMVFAYPAGVPIASTWKGDVDPVLIGAVSAAVRITFQHLCSTLKKGNLSRLFITSENGRCIIQNAGPNAILNTIMGFDADVYRIAFVSSDVANKVEKLLVDYEYK